MSNKCENVRKTEQVTDFDITSTIDLHVSVSHVAGVSTMFSETVLIQFPGVSS